MADEIQISALPLSPQLVSAVDLLAMVQNISGTLTTVKAQVSMLMTFINSNAQLGTASQVTGLGTAATKAISNTDNTIVAGVSGSISGGLAKFTGDLDGSVEDSGISISQVVKTFNNLSDLEDPYEAPANIHAQQNNGFSQPDLTGADLVLMNPAKTSFNTSNNNGTTAIQLSPPPDVDGAIAWQVGAWILFNNVGGSNGVPLKNYLGGSIMTLLASSAYLMCVKDTEGNADFIKIV